MQYSNSNYEKQFITPLPLCQLKSVSSAHFFDLALLKNFISSIIFSNRYAAPARSGSKWKFQAFLPKNASDFPPYRASPRFRARSAKADTRLYYEMQLSFPSRFRAFRKSRSRSDVPSKGRFPSDPLGFGCPERLSLIHI